MLTQTPAKTLAAHVWPASPELSALTRALRGTALMIVGSLAIWVSAKIQVPFYPVPMTLQTLVILFIGMAYGSRLGALTVLLYLAEGTMGLPVFAGTPEKGIGVAYMMGGTGGYLVGFVLAAAVTGWLAERGWDRNIASTALALLIGYVLIFTFGLLWLGTLFGWDKPIMAWGLTPFLLAAVTKLALGTALTALTWKFVGRRRDS
ncbi:MAG: biotin transporter BioY [Alphaproteobacteria bacterium]